MLITRVARSRFFDTFRQAMRHYELNNRNHSSPFRVRTPPKAQDFEAHGHFEGGELTMEAIDRRRWGGSFGDHQGVSFAFGTTYNLHNHPGIEDCFGAFPSGKDSRSLAIDSPEIVTSRYGIVRVQLHEKGRRLWNWPQRIRAEVLVRTRAGHLERFKRRISHHDYQRAHDVLPRLFLANSRNETDTSRSFFVGDFPVGYDFAPLFSRKQIAFGEMAFVTWRDFRELFRMFGNDPYALLAPDASWGHLFGNSG